MRRGRGRRVAFLCAAPLLVLAGLAVNQVYIERNLTRMMVPPGRLVPVDAMPVHLIDQPAILRLAETASPAQELPVIFIHGNPGTSSDFALVQDAMKDRRSVAVDRPGYGFSGRPSAVMPPRAQAEALRRAVRELGIERVVLAGFSYGGPVVLEWATQHPDEVAALVLLAAVGSPDEDLELSAPQALMAKPVIGPIFAWTIAPLVAPGVIEQRYQNFFAPAPVDQIALQRGVVFYARPTALASSAHDWVVLERTLPKLAAEYGKLSMPVEILSAEQDHVVNQNHGKYLREHLRTSNLRTLPGAGHGILYTHSATVAAVVRRAASRARE